MTEMLGYAGTAEIPCVIIDAQRGGPSTGLPTKTEQSDLQHALYGGHGEAPRVVIAPITVEDCFWSDDRRVQLLRALPGPGHPAHRPGPRHPDGGHPQARHATRSSCGTARPSAGRRGDYKRYELDRGLRLADGHPRRGGRPVRRHRHRARRARPPGLHAREPRGDADQALGQARRRSRTASSATRRYGDEQPDIALIGFGSTYGPVREAVDRARAEGLSVGAFYPRVLGPFPVDAGEGLHGQRVARASSRRSTSPASSPASCAASAASRSRATPSATACPSRPRTSSTSSWKGSRVEHRSRQAQAHRLQVGPQADLVPGLRRLRGPRLPLPRVRRARPRPRQHGRGLRHRLLQPPARASCRRTASTPSTAGRSPSPWA